MNANLYQDFVVDQWNSRRHPEVSEDTTLRNMYIMSTGLAGETGEVMELLKKQVRDGEFRPDKLVLELGDVLYYLTRIATWHGFTLEEVMQKNFDKLMDRRVNGKKEVA